MSYSCFFLRRVRFKFKNETDIFKAKIFIASAFSVYEYVTVPSIGLVSLASKLWKYYKWSYYVTY